MGHHWDLFWLLTRTEFRMRDQGTWAGFLWTLLHPLFIFLILYAMFTHWMAPRVENYAAYLLIGIVQWTFFATATTAGLTSLRRKAGLLSHYSFPRVLVVLSAVFSVLLSHVLEWGVLLIGLLLLGVHPSACWLLLPAVILVEVLLAVGLSCLLSVWAVHLRDLDRAWGIVLYGLFFMTPVFYTADVLGEAGRMMLTSNPVSAIIEASRGIIIDGSVSRLPSIAPAFVLACGLCGAGMALFPRLSRGLVEKL